MYVEAVCSDTLGLALDQSEKSLSSVLRRVYQDLLGGTLLDDALFVHKNLAICHFAHESYLMRDDDSSPYQLRRGAAEDLPRWSKSGRNPRYFGPAFPDALRS